ncbi:DUF4913 domain-containing protein [Saccharopolyspora pogona]|uniref:DUF4913 domain-containing protein n=1 Tax=Saccharopolyspora pogona TaxID=333966 RepID=UPI001CC24EB7|nr:DUF4913 domain-containing protein [Saccharopolyspora pogona]
MTATDEWDEALATTGKDAGDQNGDQEPAEPMFANVEAWVTQWLAPMIRRPLTGDTTWCPQWWQHPEAILRLEALWRAWEFLRTDGTVGMSVFVRDHLDPHLNFLMNRELSPLSKCRKGHQGQEDQLPVEPAPDGWWGEPDQEVSAP